MLGCWITAGAVTLLLALLSAEWYLTRRRPSRPGVGLGALIGMSAILVAFIGIGALVEAAVAGAPWLRNDPTALWASIFCLWGIFVFGALRAGPWMTARTQAPAGQSTTADYSPQ